MFPEHPKVVAPRLMIEGDALKKKKRYLEALQKYQQILYIIPNYTSAWLAKADVHTQLHQYAEALVAFQKILSIQPSHVPAQLGIEGILKILEAKRSTREASVFNTLYTEQLFRPIICEEHYLRDVERLNEKEEVNHAGFTEQIKVVLNLIEKFFEYYGNLERPYDFVLKDLFATSEQGRQLRLNKIANQTIYYFTSLPPNLGKFLDNGSLEIIKQVQDDIFLEDAKRFLRKIFETIHQFPRGERSKILDYLPWYENSWYLFEFCGAIFINDYAKDRENASTGTSVLYYDFNGDKAKIKQLVYYMASLMGNMLIVKIAILDIIQNEMKMFKVFFEQLLTCVEKDDYTALQKMPELPNLRSLLWYCKQTFNIYRLLSIIPSVPGSSAPFDKEICEFAKAYGAPIQQNTDTKIDLSELFLPMLRHMQTDPSVPKEIKSSIPETIERIYAFKQKAPQFSMQQLDRMIPLFRSRHSNVEVAKPLRLPARRKPIEYGLGSGRSVWNLADVASEDITPAKRMQLASGDNYHDVNTLKGRLSFIRKLQLIGEVFIPRNWGNHLKYLDYISAQMLSAIRDGLTHIEDHGNFDLMIDLESESGADKIRQLFRELQTLKEQIYEAAVKRQVHFPAWPNTADFDPSIGAKGWRDFASRYWDKVKEYYSLKPTFDSRNDCPKKVLLTSQEILEITNAIENQEIRKEVTQMLVGIKPYLIESNELVFNATACEKKIKKLLSKAKKEYETQRKEANKEYEVAQRQQKIYIQQAIKDNMSKFYPTIEKMGKAFWEASKDPDPDKSRVLEYLKERVTVLNKLLIESNLPMDSKRLLQHRLSHMLLRDVALLLSSTYILGQIFSLLNKFYSLTEISELDVIGPSLNARLPDYIALRNTLEHTDPILESSDLPYYQMLSEAPKAMAAFISELIFDYKDEILKLDAAKLPEPKPGKERLKQDYAFEPRKFYPRCSNDGTASTSPNVSDTESSNTNRFPTELAKSYGCTVREIEGDGNCQFRAIADQLQLRGIKRPDGSDYSGDDDSHIELRYLAVKHISNNHQFYHDYGGISVDSYVTNMKKDGTWGDEVTLRALSRHFQISIIVIPSDVDDDNTRLTINRRVEDRLHTPIVLGHEIARTAGLHYQSLHCSTDIPSEDGYNLQALLQAEAVDEFVDAADSSLPRSNAGTLRGYSGGMLGRGSSPSACSASAALVEEVDESCSVVRPSVT